jgi:PAS domain S-box-containing protein
MPDEIEDRWFRAVADYTYDWESWHDADGHVKWVNRAVQRIAGYSPSDCLAMPDYPLPLVAPDSRAKVASALVDARGQTTGEDVEFRCVRKDGESRWLSLAWQPMYESGAHLGFRTSVRDVTDRHKLREELRLHAEHLEQLVQERTARLRHLEERQRQMEKLAALGQLAAGVAHEINNPLAGIRNAFQLIKSDVSPGSEHFELIELVDREFERIASIILQMYQLYRPHQQRASSFRIVKTVSEVTCLLEATAKKRNIQLAFSFEDEAVVVHLPEGEVKQVLYNLIRNAIQASPNEETVQITLNATPDEARISVSDQGPGIPPDILPRLFEPFFTTRQGHDETGMGLGLPVSRSLIEAMGGRIDVAGGGAKGSTFTAVFPKRLAGEDASHG